MDFKDEVCIQVFSGKGGSGSASFRREKYIPKGGPDGGDGGEGGSVLIRVNPHLRTLSHLHNFQKFKAEPGQPGAGQKKSGRKGKWQIIEVPPGTVIFEEESGINLVDLKEDNSEYIAAKGGKGGRGNVWFKSSRHQVPKYAQPGLPGESKKLKLELKMIAHIGLVGFPNAGKSTLISKLTNARPKVADFPFTTLKPNLGVMTVDDAYTSLLIADIPGLIEGASEGKGLGHQFLRHIERTGLLVYMMDISDEPFEKFSILREELKNYSEVLYQKPFMTVLNKIDMIYEEAFIKEQLDFFQESGFQPFLLSALTGQSLNEFASRLYHTYIEIESEELKKREESEFAVESEMVETDKEDDW